MLVKQVWHSVGKATCELVLNEKVEWIGKSRRISGRLNE